MNYQTELQHAKMVKALAKPGEDILKTLDPGAAALTHMAMGISGEAGELLDAVKKHVMYNKALDIVNVIEELGDLEFFMEGLRQNLNIKREQTLEANLSKLALRYTNYQYSDEQSQERKDKSAA